MNGKRLRAGAACADITPRLGCSLCGSMADRAAAHVHDPLMARALVLDDGENRVALAVLDLIACSKEALARAKHEAHGHTGIPMEHMLISSTHTHSAVTPVPVFQSDPEPGYLEWAMPRVADAIRCAANRLRPARVGWAVGREERAVFNRRFRMREGWPSRNPFPGKRDIVCMNPGAGNPDIVEAAGPVDPEVAVLAAADLDGRPIAVHASYALHYVGGNPGTDVSADYFGVFGDILPRLLGVERDIRFPFTAMLANGCFGDINNIDVRRRPEQPYPYHQMAAVAEMVAAAAREAYRRIEWKDWAPLGAASRQLEFRVRKPDAEEIAWARGVLAAAPGPVLRGLPEIYARETALIAEWPDRFATPVQALRIGDLGIAALPGEPFCETGLAIKARSPFKPTFLVGMANDYAGYLPTAEQHRLGGYETWRARSSFLEESAESAIRAAALDLLAGLHGG